MNIGANVLNSLVPISQFSKGQASRIFDRVKTEQPIIVLKNNNPAAVIVSPEEYIRLTEAEEDLLLMMEASDRLDRNQGKQRIPLEKVMDELGVKDIKEDDLVIE